MEDRLAADRISTQQRRIELREAFRALGRIVAESSQDARESLPSGSTPKLEELLDTVARDVREPRRLEKRVRELRRQLARVGRSRVELRRRLKGSEKMRQDHRARTTDLRKQRTSLCVRHGRASEGSRCDDTIDGKGALGDR